ncbi:N-formylglutamate deformylase [Mesorhizobium sp. DCY119]|uniref:N-formylglutamate deformylase n=1 Tax=Mesorhizobium sp. DCY119 TaxID=2108445 RepID=UPI000E6BE991|nr:N-formylglutamate deformylase [Mesorhizobium sp. DCY119]RJG43033.1 N-formylglutamate deformylase [Mesorhizobium sp. DCY119]
MTSPSWLTVTRGNTPLLVSLPHTGIDLVDIEPQLTSRWLGQRDCDWWIDKLYDFAAGLGATVVHTAISRTVIDVNRDPSGVSLYPGQTTTGLCPTETFDGDPLYRIGEEPTPADIDRRRQTYFEPYHAALAAELKRLRALHPKVVLYDCHSIRSVIPRLFDGELPVFNFGTNDGKSADPALQKLVTDIIAGGGKSWVVNGRFKGGWITRHYGNPADGVHALQMELSNRGYMREPIGPVGPDNWPVPYDPDFAAPMRKTLTNILETALGWART